MKVEGIPEGWELVRIGKPATGEWCVGGDGIPWQYTRSESSTEFWPVIREVGPVCTWQHGVFANGWITEDQDGTMTWFSEKPLIKNGDDSWNNQPDTTWIFIRESGQKKPQFVSPPKFRDDLDWTDRIVQVGPSVEK